MLVILVSAVIFVLLDMVYLNVFKSFFMNIVQKVQKGSAVKFRLVGAVLCYAFLIFGLNYFILQTRSKTWKDAFLLGLVIYGVYETTNYALLQDWPLSAVILDTLWGGTLMALTTILTQAVQQQLL
jgi:uncharacterized membrane protein